MRAAGQEAFAWGRGYCEQVGCCLPCRAPPPQAVFLTRLRRCESAAGTQAGKGKGWVYPTCSGSGKRNESNVEWSEVRPSFARAPSACTVCATRGSVAACAFLRLCPNNTASRNTCVRCCLLPCQDFEDTPLWVAVVTMIGSVCPAICCCVGADVFRHSARAPVHARKRSCAGALLDTQKKNARTHARMHTPPPRFMLARAAAATS